MSYITHRIILVYVFPRELAGAEFRAAYKEGGPPCNTSPNRLSYDAVRYPLRLGAGDTRREDNVPTGRAEHSRGKRLFSLAVADKVPQLSRRDRTIYAAHRIASWASEAFDHIPRQKY